MQLLHPTLAWPESAALTTGSRQAHLHVHPGLSGPNGAWLLDRARWMFLPCSWATQLDCELAGLSFPPMLALRSRDAPMRPRKSTGDLQPLFKHQHRQSIISALTTVAASTIDSLHRDEQICSDCPIPSSDGTRLNATTLSSAPTLPVSVVLSMN